MRRMNHAPQASAKSTPTAAVASLHFAVLLFGFAGLFGKWIALPAVTIAFGRTIVAAAALGTLLAMRGATRHRFEWRLATNGLLLATHWVAFFQAVQTASVAVALLGCASFPMFVLILDSLILRRRPAAGQWLSATIVAAGLALLVPAFDLSQRVVQGVLWGVFSGFTFALLALGNRSLVQRRPADEIAFWQNAIAAACLLPAVLLRPMMPSAMDLGAIVVLGLLCTALAHTLFIRSLRLVSAHVASIVAALEPVYGIALAAMLLGEFPSARTLSGATLIIGATLWTSARGGQM